MESKEEKRQVVNINFLTLLRKAEQSMLFVANNAAFGLMAAESVEDSDVQMPGALMKIQPAPTTTWLADHFQGWLTGIAFREFITQFSGFLEELGCILSLLKRSQQTGDEWNLDSAWQRMNKMTFPQKLAYIESETGSPIHQAFRTDIEQINKARNCFEHRRGVVTSKDAPNGTMDVTWRACQLSERRADGAEIVVESLPFETNEGSALIGQVVNRKKTFAAGDRLQFTGPEIWEIGLALVVGSKKLTAMVESIALPIASHVKQPDTSSNAEIEENLPSGQKKAEIVMELYPDSES